MHEGGFIAAGWIHSDQYILSAYDISMPTGMGYSYSAECSWMCAMY